MCMFACASVNTFAVVQSTLDTSAEDMLPLEFKIYLQSYSEGLFIKNGDEIESMYL